jgi:hypothetical protein
MEGKGVARWERERCKMTSYLSYVPCLMVVIVIVCSLLTRSIGKKYEDRGHYGFVN